MDDITQQVISSFIKGHQNDIRLSSVFSQPGINDVTGSLAQFRVQNIAVFEIIVIIARLDILVLTCFGNHSVEGDERHVGEDVLAFHQAKQVIGQLEIVLVFEGAFCESCHKFGLMAKVVEELWKAFSIV